MQVQRSFIACDNIRLDSVFKACSHGFRYSALGFFWNLSSIMSKHSKQAVKRRRAIQKVTKRMKKVHKFKCSDKPLDLEKAMDISSGNNEDCNLSRPTTPKTTGDNSDRLTASSCSGTGRDLPPFVDSDFMSGTAPLPTTKKKLQYFNDPLYIKFKEFQLLQARLCQIKKSNQFSN